MRRILLLASFVALLVAPPGSGQAQGTPGQHGPYVVADVIITTTNPDTGSGLETHIFTTLWR